MVPPGSPSPDLTVLVVCTGNICRSALAERLGRAFLDQALGEDADRIRVVSAGTRAVVGSDMHPESALVLNGFGAEPGEFRARQLEAGHVAAADLVLTMTRRHRRAVLELAPRALARTFTLLEAADLLPRAVVPDAGDPAEQHRVLIRALADARSRRQAGEDDVADPIGRPLEDHQAAGDAIADSLLPLLSRFAAAYARDPALALAADAP